MFLSAHTLECGVVPVVTETILSLAAGIVELIKLIIQLKQQQQRQQQQDPFGALIKRMMKFKFVKELIS